jgi:hypothetical protein
MKSIFLTFSLLFAILQNYFAVLSQKLMVEKKQLKEYIFLEKL